MRCKKMIGRILKKIVPEKLYRLLANGFIIVPAYYKDIIRDNENYFGYALADTDEKALLLMRKFGHIIDKGLHRRDVTPGHSKDAYLFLKSSVERLQHSKYANDPTLKWATEKLQQYELLQARPDEFKPLENLADTSSIVSYEQFVDLVKSRRSNRFFKANIIREDVAIRLVSVSNWASSSCNKQPNSLFYTLDPALAVQCLKCCKGGTGFGHIIPSFWVFTADSRGYVWPSEYMLPYVDVSLGAQNVMLAAQTLGITGTILSWAQKSEEEDVQLRRLLSIPKEYVIVFCAVLGYAEHNYLPPTRKF